MDGGMVSEAMDATRGTLLLWRDLLTSLMAGSLVAVTTTEGRTIYPDRYRRLVMRALDVLDQLPRGMLIRHADRWHITPWGPAGTRLISQGPGLPPTWE